MKIYFWNIGKAHESHVKEGIDMFTKRINNYFNAEWKIIPSPKNSSTLAPEDLKAKEEEIILNQLNKDDYLILLDERGKQLNNIQLANFIQQRANESTKNCIFLIGGAYGVGNKLQQRANFTWSLSNLVFPHQMVRMLLAEQVYRACTILKNEKYHH